MINRLVLLLMTGCFYWMPAQNIKVMSYNIRVDFGGDGENNWEFRREFLGDQIAFHDPDFIGTQEGKAHQLQFLDSVLVHHSWFGISRDNSKTEGEFSAVFYNTEKFRLLSENTFWLSETPDVPSKAWDAAYPRICTYGLLEEKVSKRRFYVVNTHLDHVGETARSKGVSLILDRISRINKEQLPVMITGDFNSEPDTGAYRTMTSEYLDSRSVCLKKPFTPQGTFNGFKKCEPVSALIDYIFVSKHTKVLDYTVLTDSRDGRYPSDHFPLLVNLLLK